jgi:hypothetical protein
MTVLYSAARLPLRFLQPEGIARERKPSTQSSPPPPLLLGDGRSGDHCFARATRGLSPPSRRMTWRPLLLMVCFALSPVTRSRSGWPRGAAPSAPPGYVVSFVSFHERGFGVPASRFMRAILHVYGVELHNLSPNSISQAAIFAAVCEGYLGIAPHWDLWTHLFSAELFASPTGERRVRMAVRAGGCIL